MARQLLIDGAFLSFAVGCAPMGADRLTELERTLTVERSPEFSADDVGLLDGEATAVLNLGSAVLACTTEGMSITWLDDERTVEEEWHDSRTSSNLGVACNNLDWWGDHVAVSADDRVRLYTFYESGDEPAWWEAYDFAGPLEWWKDIITTDEMWSGADSAPDGWKQLDDVFSTTFNKALNVGFIAPCCKNREVLMTDAEGERWELVQLVPDDEEPPKRLSLATGEIDGGEYLLGAGGDTFYAVALDGGPDLDIKELYSEVERCTENSGVETGKVSQIRFTVGAGNLIWGLEGGMLGFDLSTRASECKLVGGGDWHVLDVYFDNDLYLFRYAAGEGVGILDLSGFW